MAVKGNLEVVKGFLEDVIVRNNLHLVERYVAPEVIDSSQPAGIQGFTTTLQSFRTVFPDLEYKLIETIVEGEKVAVRFSAKGTHLGNYLGIPPTGKKISFWGISMFGVRNGLITEHWGLFDVPGILRQFRER